MNEGLKKVMIPLGVSWVAVSLVIGLVIVVLPLSERVRVVEKNIVKYVQVEVERKESAVTGGALGTKVKIQNTIDPAGQTQNAMETKVKVLKNNF